MANKRKKHPAQASNRTRRSRRSGGRRLSFWSEPLVWIGAAGGAIVMLLVFNALQSGAFATPPSASRSGDPANLLPASTAGRSLRGGHDMELIPQQTPAPQPAPSGMAVPRLDMPSIDHDFGRVYGHWEVTHIFAVQNTGDADLVIGNLVTSCGCTTAELSSNVIPPGQRADLTVTFDADFHETRGEVVRLVWFATNDPTQPWVEVRTTANVR